MTWDELLLCELSHSLASISCGGCGAPQYIKVILRVEKNRTIFKWIGLELNLHI